jgi:hypothetical protein
MSTCSGGSGSFTFLGFPSSLLLCSALAVEEEERSTPTDDGRIIPYTLVRDGETYLATFSTHVYHTLVHPSLTSPTLSLLEMYYYAYASTPHGQLHPAHF